MDNLGEIPGGHCLGSYPECLLSLKVHHDLAVVALVAVIVAFVTLRLVIMSFVSVVMPLVAVPFMVVIVSVIMPLVSLHAMSVVMSFVIGMVAASCQNRAECHCK